MQQRSGHIDTPYSKANCCMPAAVTFEEYRCSKVLEDWQCASLSLHAGAQTDIATLG